MLRITLASVHLMALGIGLGAVPSFYWTNPLFNTKMALLVLILVLEVWPMATLIRWRIANARGSLPDAASLRTTGKRIARVSDIQGLVVLSMVVIAVMLARGYGAR